MNRQSILKTACIVVATLLAATCTNDELTDGQPEALPEGKYPLTFTATQADATDTASPQTRVSENTDGASSQWDGNEQISVQIGDATETGIYTLDTYGTIKTADKPVYWQNTASQTVTAWYPVDGTTVNLADQSSSPVYVMKATASGVAYNTPVSLKFQHQLAKVRVKLEKGATYEGDLSDATVKIKGYTSCTVDKGTINPTAEGYISTRKNNDYYEANLLPKADVPASDFIKIVNGQGEEAAIPLNENVTLTAGCIHTFTVTVGKLKEIDLSSISGAVYTVEGNVLLKGNSISKNLRLIIKGGAKVALENVSLAQESSIITCEDDATIILKGTNILSAQGGGSWKKGIAIDKGTLVIQGDGTLTATAYGAGIGANNGANITINSGKITATCTGESAGIGGNIGETCGTITINGGIIEARGGKYSAGIGSGNNSSCGDIIITGGDVKAYGGIQSPGIGNGDLSSCGNITISGASTKVYAQKGEGQVGGTPPASIGYNGYNGSCGTVTIKAGATVNNSKYTQDKTGYIQ